MGQASFNQQLWALLCRNWIFKLRTKMTTVQELLFPILTVLCLVPLVYLASLHKSTTAQGTSAVRHVGQSVSAGHIYCSPNTSEVRQVINATLKYIKFPKPNVSFYHSAAKAEEAYLNFVTSAHAAYTRVIGIDFTALIVPSRVHYSLRLRAADVGNTEILFNHAHCSASNVQRLCEASTYYYTDFLTLQLALDTAVHSQFSGELALLPNISIQMLPKKTDNMPFVALLVIGSPLMLVFAYVYFLQFLTVILVTEKESLMKEHMLMMGMRPSAYWLSWLIIYIGLVGTVTVVITFICWITPGFLNCNVLVLFLLFFLYGLTMIFLSFLATPFFRKAELAGNVMSCVALAFGFVYLAVSHTRDFSFRDGPVSAIPSWCQWLLALFSPVAFTLAIDQIEYLGLYEGGLNRDTIHVGEFPVYAAMIMLLIDCLIYFLLAVYFDIAIGGRGVAKRNLCFFLHRSFWCRPSQSLIANQECRQEAVGSGQPDVKCERISAELESKNIITMRGVTKLFSGEKKCALENLSLDIYEGQITALLGHNGAGKTTLINILTGVTPVTKGSASICGCDVSNPIDMAGVRAMMGVCAQSNIMSAELTCYDHLLLFARLKGVDPASVDAAVRKCLEDVGLSAEKDTVSKKLSGGQKRKLSLAMAIIGDPKILFLDEPTSSLDVVARRSVWTLLKRMKADRAIVLTTHYMDEADLLADRKAVISHGRLKCVGSSFFLKRHFGTGYQLSVDIEHSADVSTAASNLTQHIQTFVDDASMLRIQGQEVVFMLPLASVDKFVGLFHSLEEREGQQVAGGEDVIRGYGISMTTLEEVFMRIELENPDEGQYTAERNLAAFCDTQAAGCAPECVELQDLEQPSSEFAHLMAQDDAAEPLKPSWWWQIKALIKIRFLSERRMPSTWIVRLFMPIALVVIGGVRWAVPVGLQTYSRFELNAGYYVNDSYGEHSSVNPGLAFLSSVSADRFVRTFRADGLHVDVLKNNIKLLAITPYYLGIYVTNFTNRFLGATILYNYTAVHALPVATNLITGARLQMADLHAGIQTHVWPWPAPELFDKHKFFAATMMMTVVAMAIVFVVPTFAGTVVRDRTSMNRRQLRVSGVSFSAYWLTHFLTDIVQLVIITVASLLVFAAFHVPCIMYAGAVLSSVLLFILYLPDLLLLTYVVTFTFHSYQTARSVLPTIYLIFGIVPYIVVLVLRQFFSTANMFIETLLLLVDPLFGVFAGLGYIAEVYVMAAARANKIRPEIDVSHYFIHAENAKNFWAVLATPIVHIVCLSALLWKFEFSLEDGEVDLCRRKQQPLSVPITEPEEPLHGDETSVLVVKNLHKEYRRGHARCLGLKRSDTSVDGATKVAVVDSSFAVDAGEIFGLIGPNGAGKSTTLNAIIAETLPTRGKIRVDGQEVRPDKSYSFRQIGLCPQEDPLWSVITLEEHLECYAELRGIPKANTETVVRQMINAMKVGEHSKKYAKNLSGGTKRKLTYMMSMLGGPRMVLMDEPSTGMDPVSRRFFWDTVLAVFNSSSRRCCLLTTHHMEEADVLCSRVAIMVNGQIKCVGSTQYLKSTYGSGYILEVDVEPSTADIFDEDAVASQRSRLNEAVGNLFTEARCTEQFGVHCVYHVPQSSVTRLSKVFSALLQLKQDGLITEYSFSQSTLEQVFLQLARSQVDDELAPSGM